MKASSLLLLAVLASTTARAQRPVDFQREIRPVLSDACFHCHGPDANTRMAGLRLDTREGLFATRPSGAVVAPGKPAASLLIQRIHQEKPAQRMPPAASNKTLTDAQKTLLRRWIEQGAQWKEHWSFTPASRPAVPAGTWGRNPIDKFISKALAAKGLKPAPEADRRTLIRRAALDITGLPPAPADVEAFVKDSSPQAYEKLIDRLLTSSHYGEHRARYWLDAARYADTHGLHVDNYREMWPYRDWVIQAFNRNVPFDQFTIEQLAGDLVPNRTSQQQIASGFHRCNVTTNEGGSIVDEVAAMYAKDRVETTAIVWLGLTAGCASCHDHKFDPISQREFYQLAAFFRNTTQNPMDGNIPDTPPVLFVPPSSDEARWEELRAAVARINQAKTRRREEATPAFDAWKAKGGTFSAPVDPAAGLPLPELDQLKLAQGVEPGTGPDAGTPALHFKAKTTAVLDPPPAWRVEKGFTLSFWLLMPKADDAFTVMSQSVPRPARNKTDEDDDTAVPPQGWAIDIAGRVPTLRLAGENVVRVTGTNQMRLKPGEWAHLVFAYDGRSDQRGLALYIDGKQQSPSNRGNLILKGSPAVNVPITLGGEGRRHFQGGAIAGLRIYNRAVDPEEAGILAVWNKIDSDPAARLNYFLNRVDPEYRQLQTQLTAAEYERQTIARRSSVTHVMEEKRDSSPMAHVLFRGQYDQPRDQVAPSTPAVLPPMADSLPRNRLGLARWLMDPGNPLTARVAVNRMWQELFGTGLVKTSEDFGSQGQAPSHPELLDWLAVEFRESGWDMRRMYGLMFKSAAYRQSAA
ncbi:MAG: DUF1549 domain-containing protein, partial [Acidobacteria bacterium]|nr:DUF1549 domain-containing protein [Acidobacteriota bacterium]